MVEGIARPKGMGSMRHIARDNRWILMYTMAMDNIFSYGIAAWHLSYSFSMLILKFVKTDKWNVRPYLASIKSLLFIYWLGAFSEHLTTILIYIHIDLESTYINWSLVLFKSTKGSNPWHVSSPCDGRQWPARATAHQQESTQQTCNGNKSSLCWWSFMEFVYQNQVQNFELASKLM